MSNIEEIKSNTNPVVVEAIHKVLSPMSNPVKHGEFNRRMFLEAFVLKGGQGVGLQAEDVMDYAGMTKEEFYTILDEFMASGVIKEQVGWYDIVMYYLNM